MFGRRPTFSALIIATLTGVSQAYWRMSCGIIQTGRIDPVVNPGKIAGHVHKIAGASSEFFHLPSSHLLTVDDDVGFERLLFLLYCQWTSISKLVAHTACCHMHDKKPWISADWYHCRHWLEFKLR